MKTGIPKSHLIIISLAAVLPLLPFIDKAFHIDDTLFVWTARQILESPWDFYGFNGNWWSYESAAHDFIKNPPLTSYYMALIALFTGFSERALHIAFLVPALFAALGAYALALRFTKMPLAAALAAVATPAFLVSSTSLMCDVMLLAFWNWAMVFWIRGLDRDRGLDLAIGGVLIALAALTKYFGVSLIPLLLVYSLFHGKRGIKALAYLVIPVAALVGYQLYTQHMYGRGLLLDAAGYATGVTGGSRGITAEKAFIGVVFAGGSVIMALFLLPSVLGLRAALIGAALAAAGAAYVYGKGTMGGIVLFEPGFGWGYIAQMAACWAAGAGILLLAATDFVKRRDAASVLLLLWVAGTFVFATFVNWTINARSILPMVPAAAILVMRAAEGKSLLRVYLPLIPALAVSFFVAWADYGFADNARAAARAISEKYSGMGTKIWFQGHWGFQYYMEKKGAIPINNRSSMIATGSLVAIPLNNTGITTIVPDSLDISYLDGYDFPIPYVATMPFDGGAGFYSSVWGPVPFMLFPPKGDSFKIFYLNEDWSVPESFLSSH
ncbi:MAG: glycosyltransferase family 39 protein [Deltaproteobacteria bacterium]|nr:glycosyltransferase family 39 protein [Deltaproteobacteria bacterium]MBZ0219418.1 glycosyltransferase family 39 protein [Deltaproteobacteria bacterium]